MKRDRVLVLGATGFIGRHVVQRVAGSGAKVYCPVVASRGQEERVPSGSAVEPIRVTALDDRGFAAIIEEARPDVVVNLAASGVNRGERTGIGLLDGNAGLVVRLMAALGRHSPRAVIHAGSWSQYSDLDSVARVDEGHHMCPRSPYGAAKVAAEVLGRALAWEAAVPFVSLRLFNVYGAGEAPDRLLPFVLDRMRRGEVADLTSGTQVRDFVHVSDVADAIVAVAGLDMTGVEAFNVCTGVGTSVRSFAEAVADAAGASAELLGFGRLPDRPDEPRHVVGDPTRLADVTGWRATRDVREGVEQSVAALRERVGER